MKLTANYINSHRTAKGAFTRKQIEALGLDWPPVKGWIQRLVGTEISDKNAEIFENGRTVYNSGKGNPTPSQLQSNVNFICKNIDCLTMEQLEQLKSAISGE